MFKFTKCLIYISGHKTSVVDPNIFLNGESLITDLDPDPGANLDIFVAIEKKCSANTCKPLTIMAYGGQYFTFYSIFVNLDK
jgi:hypothetical protein